MEPVAEALKAAGAAVRLGEPLSRHTSMGIGGPADLFVTVEDESSLSAALGVLKVRGVGMMVMGRGTNLVPSDSGFRGAVIVLQGELAGTAFEGATARAGAGALLAGLVEGAAERGLAGLEFAVGIPGTVGGAVVGNAGTATEWIGGVVESVTVMDADGRPSEVPGSVIAFGYRTSSLRGAGGVVARARLGLSPRPVTEVRGRMQKAREARRGQPLDLPSAGSVFRNPPGDSAGRLIDKAGLKGFRCGGVEVSSRHANFLVNAGGGRAADVVNAIRTVRERVWADSGIILEPEVVVLDEEGGTVSLPVPAARC
jgi:UDP-N-acetylmuramate dehydrogenase